MEDYDYGKLLSVDSDMLNKVLKNDEMNNLLFKQLEERVGLSTRFLQYFLGDLGCVEFLDVTASIKFKPITSQMLNNLIVGALVYRYHMSLGGDIENVKFIAKKFGLTVNMVRKLIHLYDSKMELTTLANMEDLEDFSGNTDEISYKDDTISLKNLEEKGVDIEEYLKPIDKIPNKRPFIDDCSEV